MSKNEKFRENARNIVENIKTTGKRPTIKELMKVTGTCKGHSQKISQTATAYKQREEVALLISQLKTGNIPGFEPVCSLEDISKQKANE